MSNAPTAEGDCFTATFDAHAVASMLVLPADRAALREKGKALVMSLADIQLALGKGYLSAFPATHFDRLQALTPVWAPYYVVSPPLQSHNRSHDGDMTACHLCSACHPCTMLAAVSTVRAHLWVGFPASYIQLLPQGSLSSQLLGHRLQARHLRRERR